MKNFKLVSALLFLAISFTACEKNDLSPISSPEASASRQAQVILPIWNLTPTEIKDESGQLEMQFTYDSKKRLTALNQVGLDFQTFEYNLKGQLQRVNHFENASATSSKDLTYFDIMVYNTEPSNKPSGILRYKNGDATFSDNTNLRPSSTFEILYDNNMRKVSETEFTFLGSGTAKGITRAQHYQYDAKGNVTSISVLEGGVVKGIIQFRAYDSFRNILASLPVLNMLPFQINGVNNATLIANAQLYKPQIATTFVSKTIPELEVSKKYEYNDYGFPISETTITGDGSYTEFIKYNMPN